MATRLKGRLSLLLLSFAVVMLIFPAMAFAQDAGGSGGSSSPAPTIQSDKDDYAPGETVTLTGSNWQPGESVNINVNDDEGSTWNRNVDVTADENGAIRDEFQLPDWLVATYKVTATGAQSGVATTSFTDGNIVIKADPPGTNFNGTFTEFNGTNCTGTASSPVSRSSTDTPADPVGSTNSNDFSQAVPNTSSLKIEASAHNSAGNGFKGFTAEDPDDSSRIIENGSFDPASSPRIICINGAFTGGKTFFVNYFPNNQAPVNSVPAALQTTNEDTAKVFNSANGNLISISDPDANPTSSLKVTLSVPNGPPNGTPNGTLTLSGTTGLTFTAGSNGSANMTFTGTITNINTALNGMSFTPNANYFGPSLFTIITDDQGNTGTGGAKSDTDTVNIFVTPVNDAPVAVDDSGTTAEDTPLTVAAPGVLSNDTDVDNPNNSNAGLTVKDSNTSLAGVQPESGPSNGTLTLNANGSYTYTPDSNFNGTDSFTYKATDGSADSNTATVTITVRAVNDAPDAVNDTAATDEDTAVLIDVRANDTDVDGDSLSITNVTTPAHGTAVVDNGKINYTPAPNYNGSDSFSYTISDGNGGTDTADVGVNVRAVNDAPTCEDVTLTTDEDTQGSTSPDCSDVDGDDLTYQIVDQAADGTASVVNGELKYDPDLNFNGPDSFTYKANDGTVDSAAANVDVTVNPVNDAPVAADDNYSVDEDVTLTADGGTNPNGVLFNDEDVDGDSLTATLVDDVAHGNLTLNSDGTFTYKPDANFNGSDEFTYKANDGTTDSNVAKVKITVNPVNDAPTCEDVTLTTDEDTQGSTSPDCSDVDGDDLTYQIVDQAADGTASVVNGELKYDPDLNFNGPDSFTYKANDGTVDSAAANVDVTVNPVNDAPVATGDAYEVDEDGELNIAAPGVLANDEDVDNASLTAILVSDNTDHGELTLNADGSFSYTPDPNFFGEDSFTYKANDGSLDSNVVKVTITVNPVNDAPVATADAYEVDEDNPLNIDAPGVLDNDTDVDNPKADLDALLVSDVANGTLDLNADGSFSYTPDPNFFGEDSFTYKANDGSLDSNTVKVTITVNPVNDAPDADIDEETTPEDTPVYIDVLDNDDEGAANEADQTLTVTRIVDAPANGTAQIITSGPDQGKVLYTPDDDFFGEDSFTYEVCDDGDPVQCTTKDATVNVIVTAVNDAPVATADAYDVNEDNPLNIAAPGVLANDEDVEDDTLTAVLVSDVANGTLDLNADGSFSYTPDPNFFGEDSFTYKANDGSLDSNVVKVTITVNPVNDAPVATADAYEIDEDNPLNIAAPGVLDNDTDVDNPKADLDALLVSDVEHGDLTLNADGSFSYTPDDDFFGEDSFTYKANDGSLDSNVVKVTITVNPVNDTPVADIDRETTPEDTPVSIDVLANDNEGPANEGSQTLYVKSVGDPANGTAQIITSGPDQGKVLYTPDENFHGSDTFTYEVCDTGNPEQCTTENATVYVTVTPVNDAPTADAQSVTTNEDVAKEITLTGDDVDGDTLTYTVVSGPSHGTLSGTGADLTYTPGANYHGLDSFTFKVNDGSVDSDPATVSITVNSDNDKPTVKTAAADDTGKNEGATLSTNGAFEDTADNDPLTITKTSGAGTVVDNGNGTWSWSLLTRDNISGSVEVTATDGNGGSVSDTFNYSTINVAPAAFNPTFVFNPVLGTATAGFSFSDAGFDDTHGPNLSYFTWSDIGNQPASVTEANGAGTASATRTLNPGCYPNLSVTGTAKDDDLGQSAPLTIYSPNSQTSVHGKGFLPPIMDNERNIAKYGNVVPVKVQLTNSCTGVTVTNVTLYITIAKGAGDEAIEDTNVIAESVSAADTGSQMRVVDGRYMYNLSTKNMSANSDWTVRVRLGSTTGPVLLQAVFYPKK